MHLHLNRLTFRVSICLVLVSASLRANAGAITVADFGPSAGITDFDGLGLGPAPSTPLVIDGHAFDVDGGVFRYQNLGISSPASVTGEQLATNADRETITISLNTPKKKAGLLVTGLFSDGWNIRVDFLDASDNVLGSQNLAGNGTPMVFSGWESTGNDISTIQVTDNRTDFRIIAIDNLIFEPIPEPAAMMLFLLGVSIHVVRKR